MNNDFQTILEFLGRLGPEVAGHHTLTPQQDQAAQLLRLAQGQCTEPERAELCRVLQQNPTWLRWLAQRVKLARDPGHRPQAAT